MMKKSAPKKSAGKVSEYGGMEKYPSKKAMMAQEKKESKSMEASEKKMSGKFGDDKPFHNVTSYKQRNRLLGGTVTKSVHEGRDREGKDYYLEMKTIRDRNNDEKKRVIKMDGVKTIQKYNPGDYNPKSVKVIKKK